MHHDVLCCIYSSNASSFTTLIIKEQKKHSIVCCSAPKGDETHSTLESAKRSVLPVTVHVCKLYIALQHTLKRLSGKQPACRGKQQAPNRRTTTWHTLVCASTGIISCREESTAAAKITHMIAV